MKEIILQVKRALILLLFSALFAPGAIAQNKKEIPVSPERLEADVAFLTGLPGGRNHRNLKALNAAADYILEELKKTGAEDVYEQVYFVEGIRYRNIIARFGPLSGSVLVVGAH